MLHPGARLGEGALRQVSGGWANWRAEPKPILCRFTTSREANKGVFQFSWHTFEVFACLIHTANAGTGDISSNYLSAGTDCVCKMSVFVFLYNYFWGILSPKNKRVMQQRSLDRLVQGILTPVGHWSSLCLYFGNIWDDLIFKSGTEVVHFLFLDLPLLFDVSSHPAHSGKALIFHPNWNNLFSKIKIHTFCFLYHRFLSINFYLLILKAIKQLQTFALPWVLKYVYWRVECLHCDYGN